MKLMNLKMVTIAYIKHKEDLCLMMYFIRVWCCKYNVVSSLCFPPVNSRHYKKCMRCHILSLAKIITYRFWVILSNGDSQILINNPKKLKVCNDLFGNST